MREKLLMSGTLVGETEQCAWFDIQAPNGRINRTRDLEDDRSLCHLWSHDCFMKDSPKKSTHTWSDSQCFNSNALTKPLFFIHLYLLFAFINHKSTETRPVAWTEHAFMISTKHGALSWFQYISYDIWEARVALEDAVSNKVWSYLRRFEST